MCIRDRSSVPLNSKFTFSRLDPVLQVSVFNVGNNAKIAYIVGNTLRIITIFFFVTFSTLSIFGASFLTCLLEHSLFVGVRSSQIYPIDPLATCYEYHDRHN